MDRNRLDAELAATLGGTAETRRVVTRQARDLADSGRVDADFGYELTAGDVVGHLEDAPDGCALVERWNWWVGSLELVRPEYGQFRVRDDTR